MKSIGLHAGSAESSSTTGQGRNDHAGPGGPRPDRNTLLLVSSSNSFPCGDTGLHCFPRTEGLSHHHHLLCPGSQCLGDSITNSSSWTDSVIGCFPWTDSVIDCFPWNDLVTDNFYFLPLQCGHYFAHIINLFGLSGFINDLFCLCDSVMD